MKELLKLLSENSKFTTEEMALILDKPKNFIEEEIKRYENSEIIKGYKAVINWEKVKDADVTALIELKVTPEKESGFDNIASKVMEFEEVENVFLMAGAYDLAVFVKAPTIQDIAMFVSTKLSTMEQVLSTSTHFLLKRYKESGMVFCDSKKEEDKRSFVV